MPVTQGTFKTGTFKTFRAHMKLTYSAEEARKALGVGRNTMYEALKRGDIPSIRIGKRILIPIDSLEKLLKRER
jgi:excisionase family DNA binding protein